MTRKLLRTLIPSASRPDRVGPRVAAMRDTLEMTKAQFADSLGLDRSSLTKIEKGVLGLDIAIGVAIATRYGFGLDFIYRGDLDDVPSDLRPALLSHLAAHDAL